MRRSMLLKLQLIATLKAFINKSTEQFSYEVTPPKNIKIWLFKRLNPKQSIPSNKQKK